MKKNVRQMQIFFIWIIALFQLNQKLINFQLEFNLNSSSLEQ